MRDLIVNATKDQVEDFLSSVLWKDIQRELVGWKRGFEQELLTLTDDAKENNPSTASVLMNIGDISGRTKAVDYLLALPKIFLAAKVNAEKIV
jgi:hypothetical protein